MFQGYSNVTMNCLNAACRMQYYTTDITLAELLKNVGFVHGGAWYSQWIEKQQLKQNTVQFKQKTILTQ